MRHLLLAAGFLAALTNGQDLARHGSGGGGEKRVVCYYTNWSVYRKGLAKYTPQNINPYLCTHLVYAFGGLTDEFEIKPFDSYQDLEQGGYAKFNGLKQYNKGLKTLLAIGGWNEGSGRFSELVSLPEFRKTFIISAIKHLRRYNFDGLDLDWEYPASRDGSLPEDRENYALLVTELRVAFNDEGRKVKQGRLLLTMAVPAGQNYIDKGYNIPSLTRDLDFFNILNYDYHSAYEPSVNHHAALLPEPGSSEYAWNAQLNVDWTVKYYISLGADKDKLVIGIPTYGRSYTLIDGNFTDFGSSADGPGEQGTYTKEKGFMAFYEVCENIASHGWKAKKPYPRRIGAYAFSGNQWVGYDDEKIVARKAEYVNDNGLGGIMYWSLDNDDFRGICNGEQYPLVEAGKKALFGGEATRANEARDIQSASSPAVPRRERPSVQVQAIDDRRRTSLRPDLNTRTRTRTRPDHNTRTRPDPNTRTRTRTRFQTALPSEEPIRTQDRTRPTGSRDPVSSRRPTSLSARLNNRRRPSSQTTTTTTTTTTPRPTRRPTTGRTSLRRPGGTRRRPGDRQRPQKQQRRRPQTTTIDPLNTPAPPTTPSPISGYKCKREGFYPNPDDCHKYYWCLSSGASGLGIVAHAFSCPSDLVFSKVIDGCDHPTRTKCSTEKRNRGGAGATTPGTSTPIPTTTEIPVDYSYYDEKQYEDEEYYDYYYDYESDPLVGEAPSTADSGHQNSGGNQFLRGSGSDATEAGQGVGSSSGGFGGRQRPQYSTITRDRSETPEPPLEAPSEQHGSGLAGGTGLSGGSAVLDGNRNARPQYSTIRRQRPSTSRQQEARGQIEAEIALGEEREVGGTTGRRQYVTIERQRPATSRQQEAQAGVEAEAALGEPREGGGFIGRKQYVTIERQRPPTSRQQGVQGEVEPKTALEQPHEGDGSIGRKQYVTIERQRPPTSRQQEAQTGVEAEATFGQPRGVVESTGGRQYVNIERQQPTNRRPEADKSVTPQQPALQYVSIDRSRSRTTPSTPLAFSPAYSEASLSPAPGLEQEAPTTSRYVTLERSRPAPTTEATTPATLEETTVTSLPSRRPAVRIRTHAPTTPRPTPPPAFRVRPTSRKQDVTPQPDVRQRTTRPRPGATTLSTRSQSDRPRVTLPLIQFKSRPTRPDPLQPTISEDEPVRPRPIISTPAPVTSPTTLPPAPEDPITEADYDIFADTTFIPETSPTPTLFSLFTSPSPTTPAPLPILTTRLVPRPFPTTATPDLRLSSQPRPTPRPRPTPHPRTTPHPQVTRRPQATPRPQATSRPRLTSVPRPTTPAPRPTTPRVIPLRSQRPRIGTPPPTRRPTIPGRPAASAILNNDYYDYYYDDLEGALTGTLGQLATLTEKAVLMADGSVQCYDTGYFAHPDSCKKFISCSKTVRGLVRGWVYTCPQQLVFDPVGGMCNWAETVDCGGSN